MSEEPSYKTTLNLPATAFPMKANLAQKEPETLARWESEDLYGRIQRSREGRPLYVLHDGPPYANGHIHLGHVLNKVLKDVIVKYHTMKGERAPYVPGWDCHGLPIEHNVAVELRKQKRAVGTPELRRLCREYADNFLDVQRTGFKRLGVLGDWANPYVTMDAQYEGDIVRELARLVEAGVVYRGTKPVHWCASCRTALAEAEVEYEDHESPSIYVTFRLPEPTPALLAANLRDDLYVVIWTTTPWTLPANRGVALNPEFRYSAVTPKTGPFAGKHLIVADKLVGAFLAETGLR
ncbi:MAG: class I tRNA ligase family protein, partial [Candidatus Methylomirabilis sp.]|nr:class I tRNA ligase family protein [Deltaproteobacteria bacterium]